MHEKQPIEPTLTAFPKFRHQEQPHGKAYKRSSTGSRRRRKRGAFLWSLRFPSVLLS